MTVLKRAVPPLEAGDSLTREEFIRRWQASPEVKKAELIGGIVYMPPVGSEHGESSPGLVSFLHYYAGHTPGCVAGENSTWHMLEDAPQPDAHLRILRECGGASWVERGFLHGAPELAAETALSSSSYDLHQKKDLYEKAGVQEYVAYLLRERRIAWFRLVGDKFQEVEAPSEGILRSTVFPGLWLDVPAFLAQDLPRVLATLNGGLGSSEHAEFVRRLEAERARRGSG
ncbi:MAG: Uma2 family endonuclease [Planctomycetes bacterium]|nr:Uma2 family endonuclease [Planctomycetota bacterium]